GTHRRLQVDLQVLLPQWCQEQP
ncbi:hypothetical protein BN1723_020919, partial [Verticillium longisporum]